MNSFPPNNGAAPSAASPSPADDHNDHDDDAPPSFVAAVGLHQQNVPPSVAEPWLTVVATTATSTPTATSAQRADSSVEEAAPFAAPAVYHPPNAAAQQNVASVVVPSPILPHEEDDHGGIIAVKNPIAQQHDFPSVDQDATVCAARQYCGLVETPLPTTTTDTIATTAIATTSRCMECENILHGIPSCGVEFPVKDGIGHAVLKVKREELVHTTARLNAAAAMAEESGGDCGDVDELRGALCWWCVNQIQERRGLHVDNDGSGVKRDIDQVTMEGDNLVINEKNNQSAKKIKLEESELKMEESEVSLPPLQKAATSGKKDRKEFTAAEKLHILSLLELPPADQQGTTDSSAQPMTLKQLRDKYQVSKSSLHRWKQQRSRLQELVSKDGMACRKRDTKDLLTKVKSELKKFAEENLQKGPNERLAITTPVIQAQAVKIRDGLLERHETMETEEGLKKMEEGVAPEEVSSNLSEEEYNALKSFKVTKSWAGRVASSMGLLSCPRTRRPKKNKAKAEESITLGTTATEDNGESEGLDTTEATADTAPNLPPLVSLEQAKQNTMAYLISINPNPAANPTKPKKERREFSALEKLHILQEMDCPTNPLKMEQICQKYHTSKSSVFRWKIQHKAGQLEAMVSTQGRGHCKRVVDDKLHRIKVELEKFIEINKALPPCRQMPMNGTVIQAQAQLARDKLLAEHEAAVADSNHSGKLMREEELALRNFKASKGWARKTAVRYGWRIVGGGAAMDVGGGELGGLEGVVNGGMFVEGEHVEGNDHMAMVVDGGGEMLHVALADVEETNHTIEPGANHGIEDPASAHHVMPMAIGGEEMMHAPPADSVVDQVVEMANPGVEDHHGVDADVETPVKVEQHELVNDMVDSVMETVHETVDSVMMETAVANNEQLTHQV